MSPSTASPERGTPGLICGVGWLLGLIFCLPDDGERADSFPGEDTLAEAFAVEGLRADIGVREGALAEKGVLACGDALLADSPPRRPLLIPFCSLLRADRWDGSD